MDGYVDPGHGGWTELRVHGVSGTPPDRMLQHPRVRRVAGDSRAGFYRRHWTHRASALDTAADRVEAYSWGGLTAGNGGRALWLLLLPFLLVNVAFWALPATDRAQTGRLARVRSALRRPAEVVQRLFGLSITATLVLAMVSVSMDLIGWQCVRETPDTRCGAVSQLDFLTWDWLATPGRRLAVSAAVPLAAIGLLWILGRMTWLRTEFQPVPAAPPAPRESPLPALEDRAMWNGAEQVRRLRRVHVAAGVAIVGVFLLVPFVAGRPFVTGILVALSVLLAAATVLVCWPSMSERRRPSDERPRSHRWLDVCAAVVIGATLAAVAIAVVVVVVDGDTGDTGDVLPGLATTIQWLLCGQVALLVLTVILLLVLTPRKADDPLAPADGRGVEERTPPAWYGLAPAVFMLAALMLSTGFAAGLGLRVADLLGTPAPDRQDATAFVVPIGYFWAAALTVPVAAVLLAFALIGWLLVWARTGTVLERKVKPAYPRVFGPEEPAEPEAPEEPAEPEEPEEPEKPNKPDKETVRRARRIAREWALASVTDVGRRLVGLLVGLVSAVVAGGLVGYLIDQRWMYDEARGVVTVGSFLIGGFVVVLYWLGRQAYRRPTFRRTVGVLWDIGTFWPRAAHPLAPPCYPERAVPDLITRIRHFGGSPTGRVVLSCHSQGAVLGAAVIMQLTPTEAERVALLTYGSPVRSLYARFFPAHVNRSAILRTGAFLTGDLGGRPPDADPAGRRTWPWRNLHRPSDPIGGPVLFTYPATEPDPAAPAHPDNDDVDLHLIDPSFGIPPGDTCYPETCGHSDYYSDPAFAAAIGTIKRIRVR